MLKKSINITKELGLRKIHIEGDNQTIIYALKGGYSYPWEIDMLIANIGNILQSFDEVILDFIPREINYVADFFAKMATFLSHLGKTLLSFKLSSVRML